jgi:hypothetical protein
MERIAGADIEGNAGVSAAVLAVQQVKPPSLTGLLGPSARRSRFQFGGALVIEGISTTFVDTDRPGSASLVAPMRTSNESARSRRSDLTIGI